MVSELNEKDKRITLLEVEGEELTAELSVAEKKAAIREAKQRYGSDWKKMLLGAVKNIKVDTETMQTLHGMGVDGSLRDYNDPSRIRRE